MDRPLVALDCETANFRGAPHLLELGAVRVIDGEVQETFEALVCPSIPIDPETSAVHGLTEDDVRTAPPPAEVLKRFTNWVGQDWLAAHNAGVDSKVLAFEYSRSGQSPPPGPFLCSLELAVRHIPEAPDHTLDTLVQHLDLEDCDRHRALADAVSCWKVIEECLDRDGGLADAKLGERLAGRGRPVTISSRLPARPRLSSRLRPLERARVEEHPLWILYGDPDSGAPARLEVLPRFLYERGGRGYMEAECQASGLLKTYRLERVRKVLE